MTAPHAPAFVCICVRVCAACVSLTRQRLSPHSPLPPLPQALNCVAAFSGVSNLVQHSLAEVLGDRDWALGFVRQNCAALLRSYEALAAALEAAGIPFLPAVGGMFVWVDLR